MTPTTEAPEASAPAYSDWQGATGEGWAANASHYETMLANVGAALLDHAGLTPGEHTPARHPGLVGRLQPQSGPMVALRLRGRRQARLAQEPVGE